MLTFHELFRFFKLIPFRFFKEGLPFFFETSACLSNVSSHSTMKEYLKAIFVHVADPNSVRFTVKINWYVEQQLKQASNSHLLLKINALPQMLLRLVWSLQRTVLDSHEAGHCLTSYDARWQHLGAHSRIRCRLGRGNSPIRDLQRVSATTLITFGIIAYWQRDRTENPCRATTFSSFSFVFDTRKEKSRSISSSSSLTALSDSSSHIRLVASSSDMKQTTWSQIFVKYLTQYEFPRCAWAR